MENYITRAEHNEYVKRMDDEHKNIKQRLIGVEKTNSEFLKIAVSVEKLATNMGYMAKEQKSQGERLERLEKAPADKWNHLAKSIIAAFASGLVGFIVANIFK